MNPDIQKMICRIIENFDFIQVHKVMRFMNWEWANDDGGLSVPSLNKIISESIRVLNDAFHELCGGHHDSWAVEAGGLRAECSHDSGNYYMRLLFIVEDWDVDSEEISK